MSLLSLQVFEQRLENHRVEPLKHLLWLLDEVAPRVLSDLESQWFWILIHFLTPLTIFQIRIHNLSVFKNLTSNSFSDNYCISIFIDNWHIWRWNSTIWYFLMCQIFLINIENPIVMKNYLLKLNIYATGHLFWCTSSLENRVSCCHWIKPNISPEFKGPMCQMAQIKAKKTSLVLTCIALLFILVRI